MRFNMLSPFELLFDIEFNVLRQPEICRGYFAFYAYAE